MPDYGLTPEQIEEWEERAGILEFDAGMGREESEWLAAQIVKINSEKNSA